MALKVISFLVVVLLARVGGDVIPKVLSTRNLMELAAPVSQKIQNERCRNHSEIYLRDLKMLKLWAAEMFDATSKFPSGILSGSTYGMGNFDECLKVKVPLQDDSFSGKYCLTTLKIQFNTDLEANHEERYLLASEDRLKNFNVSVFERIVVLSKDKSKRQRNEIKWSFCIPSSCSAEDLHVHLTEVTNGFNALEDFQIIPFVDENNCHVSNDLALDGADIAFIVFIGFVVGVAFVATGYDFYMKSNMDTKQFEAAHAKTSVWKTFSLVSNLKKLARRSSSSDGLDCLHGVKVFSMFLIIMGHRFMFNLGSPIVNSDYVEGFYGKFDVTILLNGPIIVDSFFVISGFLACFLLLTEYKKREHGISFLKLYLHRILRLLPSYAVVIAFYCTLLAKVGSGPLWKEKILIERERCRASWWANLLFVNNYVHTDKICMFQSWFITCDMHFFIITPSIVWLLWRKPKQGLITLALLTVLSIASTYVTVFLKRLDGILILYMKLLTDPTTDESFINVYIPTHTRATPYLIGMLTGYIRYKIKYSDFKFSLKFVTPAWIISFLLMLVTVYSAYFFYIPGRSYDVYASAVYASFHHLAWSVCISWLILALSTGYGSWIEPILSWRGLTPLSRITYCAFLCHGGIQLYTMAISRQPVYISIFTLTWNTLGDIALAYALGLIICLLFESPVAGIEKLIFQEKPKMMTTKDLGNNHIVIVTDLKTTTAT